MTMIQDGPLDALAARLVVPKKAGVYLTKSEMVVLARLSEGSLRVNERKRMLADVLKSPDNVADLGKLVARLVHFCEAHVTRYDELAETYPHLEPHVAPWRAAAKATIDVLEDVRFELEAT